MLSRLLLFSIYIFLLLFQTDPSEKFLYDASRYFAGAEALIEGENWQEKGGLYNRGFLTSFVFIPSVSLSTIFETISAPYAVLLYNAFVIALFATFVIPRISTLFSVNSEILKILVGLTFVLIVKGFVPYPLMDVWALILFSSGLVLLFDSKIRFNSIYGGLLLGLAVNLRPSYLLLVFSALLFLIPQFKKIVGAFLGSITIAAGQMLFNILSFAEISIFPIAQTSIQKIQTQYSGFVYRYDTVAYTEFPPQRFYCFGGISREFVGKETGLFENVTVWFLNPFETIQFLALKLLAPFFWSDLTPYEPVFVSENLFGFFIFSLTFTGIFSLIFLVAINKSYRNKTSIFLLALIFFGQITLLLSTPETRFALPVIFYSTFGFYLALGALKKNKLLVFLWLVSSLLVAYFIYRTIFAYLLPLELGVLATPGICS